MSKFLVSKLQRLEEYVPGEQPRDKSYVKLNTNESPYSPSHGVTEAVGKDEIGELNLYSDPLCSSLTEEFCRVYGIKSENVIFGNGSDEILNYCFAAFFSDVNPVLFPDITYGFYKVFADLYSCRYTEIPLDENLCVNVNDYINTGKGIVLANPNAPTGIFLAVKEIEKIISSNRESVVIIDEAYIDFGGESVYRLCDKYDNLIVVGTFSKSRSLAGARLGFAIGGRELIGDLNRIKFSTNPYNINRLTQLAGIAALRDNDYYSENCKKIILNREYTEKRLKELGFSVLPSEANFVFAKHGKLSGTLLYAKLKEKGVLVRHFDRKRISEYLRITIGTKEQMEKLFKATEEILKCEESR